MTTKVEVSASQFQPVPPGTKIKYQHFYKTTDGRPLVQDAGCWYIIGAMGADFEEYKGTRHLFATEAWLEDDTYKIVAKADAYCNKKDTPNKKLGRLIAHNRCIKAYAKEKANAP